MNRRAMEDKRKIDKLFEAGSRGFEAEPPADAWPGIEERLLSEKRKKRVFYWRIASTAAAIVLAFFSGYYFNLQYRADQVPVPLPAREEQMNETPRQGQEERMASEEIFSGEQDEIEAERAGTARRSDSQVPSRNTLATPPLTRETEPELQVDQAMPAEEAPAGNTASFTQAPSEQTEAPAGQGTRTGADPHSTGSKEQGTPSAEEDVINDSRSVTIAEAGKPLVLEKAPFTPDDEVAGKEENNDGKLASTFDPDQAAALKTNKELEAKKEAGHRYKKFSIAVAGSPTFAFRNVNVKQGEAAFASENVEEENVKNSFTAGMDLAYRTGSRTEVQAGVYVNNWHQSSDQVFLQGVTGAGTSNNSSFKGNTSSGSVVVASDPFSFTDVSSIGNGMSENAYVLLPNIEQTYRFVEVPLSVGYYVVDRKRWTLSFRTGLSSRFLTNSDVRLVYPDGSEKAYDGLELSNFTLQLIAGSGVGYKLHKNLKLNLQPSLRYGLTPVYRSDEIDTYFHQFLIFTGVTYQF